MSFSDFHGNRETITQLRRMLASDRFPHALILAGPAGSGKYKLAQMIAQTMNCVSPIITDGLPEYCGHCANCLRIAQADDLEQKFAEAVEAREAHGAKLAQVGAVQAGATDVFGGVEERLRQTDGIEDLEGARLDRRGACPRGDAADHPRSR